MIIMNFCIRKDSLLFRMIAFALGLQFFIIPLSLEDFLNAKEVLCVNNRRVVPESEFHLDHSLGSGRFPCLPWQEVSPAAQSIFRKQRGRGKRFIKRWGGGHCYPDELTNWNGDMIFRRKLYSGYHNTLKQQAGVKRCGVVAYRSLHITFLKKYCKSSMSCLRIGSKSVISFVLSYC